MSSRQDPELARIVLFVGRAAAYRDECCWKIEQSYGGDYACYDCFLLHVHVQLLCSLSCLALEVL